jgi:mannose-6-phosphate isomerase-like protein (cupin superfamily)
VFYSISFKPYGGSNKAGTSLKTSPLFVDWKTVGFKPSENGGRRNIMQQKTSVLKELEIHVTTLKEGFPSHAAHSHPDEEIILVKKGFVEETIKGEPFQSGPGSIIFLTNDDLHGISNSGKGECEYYAIRWLTYQP